MDPRSLPSSSRFYGRKSASCLCAFLPIHRLVKKIVTVVICGLLTLSAASASASSSTDALLHNAARLSGLRIKHAVPRTTLSGSRYDRLLAQARSRDYPPALRSLDARLYTQLGLTAPTLRTAAALSANSSKAWYDPSARKLVLRRGSAAKRSGVINELVRALVDQNFNLRRLVGLRIRDRDRALAARGIVNGTAALASGVRPAVVRGASLERFEELEDAGALSAGKTLASQLRFLGGAPALASALRSFPSTTEQLLHIDKFLEREPALPVGLPAKIGADALTAAENFGELDVRSLLRAFGIPNAADVADGWGGGTTRSLHLAVRSGDHGPRAPLGHGRGRGRMAGRGSSLCRRCVSRCNSPRLPAARSLLGDGLDADRGRSARNHRRARDRTGRRRRRGGRAGRELTLDSSLRSVQPGPSNDRAFVGRQRREQKSAVFTTPDGGFVEIPCPFERQNAQVGGATGRLLFWSHVR